jgi:hypothetical protein
MPLVASKQLGWAPDTLTGRRRQRPDAWRPDRGVGTDTRQAAQAESGELCSQLGVVAIAAAISTTLSGSPAVWAAWICCKAIWGLAWNEIVSGTLGW